MHEKASVAIKGRRACALLSFKVIFRFLYSSREQFFEPERINKYNNGGIKLEAPRRLN